jgi:hypothetical protein
MNSPQTQFNAARYQLLQRASFWQGDDARANLRAWNAQISWDDHLNADEYRLLPQLARICPRAKSNTRDWENFAALRAKRG